MEKYKKILKKCGIILVIYLLVIFICTAIIVYSNGNKLTFFMDASLYGIEAYIIGFLSYLLIFSRLVWPIYIVYILIVLFCLIKIHNLKKKGMNENE